MGSSMLYGRCSLSLKNLKNLKIRKPYVQRLLVRRQSKVVIDDDQRLIKRVWANSSGNNQYRHRNADFSKHWRLQLCDRPWGALSVVSLSPVCLAVPALLTEDSPISEFFLYGTACPFKG